MTDSPNRSQYVANLASHLDQTQRLLLDRAKTHGEYKDHARISIHLKSTMEETPNWSVLNPEQRESLHMIAHKIGRILAGDPEVRDHWDDVAGYARLVADKCTK